jgi:hypothetical protein
VGSQIKIKWILNIASVITIFDGLGLELGNWITWFWLSRIGLLMFILVLTMH